jgi:ABC-2 type transport system ATP-binding protein
MNRYPNRMSDAAISVDELCKNFGPVKAIDRVTFAVPPGQLVGFLGNNGAGKSTTMKVLTTFLPASSGTARVAGFDVMYQADDVRRRLGYLPESVPLYPEMRVEEYLDYRARIKGVDRGARRARIDANLERCRIREVRRRLLGTLSKGYRQRVGLADTLLADPDVLILDEPLSGLDPIQQEETLAAIRSLGGRHTVLFSSHHLPDVEKVCDRVIIIHRGRLRFDGKLSDIRSKVPRVIVESRASPESLSAVLVKLPGVAAVDAIPAVPATPGYAAASISVAAGMDIRESVAAALCAAGLPLRRLELKAESLEDIYMTATIGGAA